MKVLISGAGIAGPTLAYWLAHYGMEPTVVEKSPKLRTGGYIIDFWGAGFEVADRMNLIPQITQSGYQVQQVSVVDENGRRIAGFPAASFVRIAKGRYTSLPRGELARLIFSKLHGVDTIFGDSIVQLSEFENGVRVTFETGMVREFDLVIGAGGLHSGVRQIVFGNEGRFEKYLGYKVAAFEVQGYTPRDESTYLMHTEVGQQVSRFSMRDDRTMILFIFTDRDPNGANDIEQQKALLRERFGRSGWECPKIIQALDATDELYFDRVSQIRMGGGTSWSRGRVSLVGDAAFCVSFLAGQGSALAMVAAYILAGELYRARGNYQSAFRRYQEIIGPFVLKKQDAAIGFASAFAPRSKVAMFARNHIMNLLRIPWIADLAMGRDFNDRIPLPEY